MAIIRDSTKKLSDINQNSQFMDSIYRNVDKVFSKYVPDGTVLYDELTSYGNSNVSNNGYITPNVSINYDFGKPGASLGIPIDRIHNGIVVYTSVEDYQDRAYTNAMIDAPTGGYMAGDMLPNSFEIPKTMFTGGKTFPISVALTGEYWVVQHGGSLTFSVSDDSLVVRMNEISASYSTTSTARLGIYPIIQKIVTYQEVYT